jgi:O-antigen/teichoic acid export membrane protein
MQLQRLIIQHIFWRGLYFLSLFALNILISRHFKADGSGWIYYVINNLSFLILLISLSLESGAAYHVSTGGISSSKIGSFCLLWAFVAAIFALIFMNWVIPATYSSYISRPDLILGCFFYTLGVLLSTYFVALFFANQIFRLPNLLLLLFNLLLILLYFFFRNQVFVLNHFLSFYFLSFLIQGLVMSGAFFIHSHSSGKWDWGLRFPSRPELKMILHYSLLALAGNIVFFLVCRVDYWFVRRYCSYSDLGNYIQVSKIVQILILIPSIMASTIFPLVAGGQKEEVNRALKILTRCLLFGIAVICLMIAVIGQWAFPFIFGKSFMQMHILFILLIPGVLALSAHYPLTAYYAGKKKIIVNIKGSLLGLLLIVAGDLLFIPKVGVIAAPLISSIGYLSYYFYVLIVFSKEYRTSISGFFTIRRSDIPWMKKMILP